MKKKILLMVFALLFVCSGAMISVACGSKSPKKTLEMINCTVDHPNFGGSSFIYYYGDKISITKDNFSVTAVYSDGSEEKVTDFSLEKTGLPDVANQITTYSLTISYKTAPEIVYQVVVSKKALNPGVDSYIQFTFSGAMIDVVEQTEAIQQLISSNKMYVDEDLSTQTATDVGTYTLVLKPTEGYESDIIEIVWEILPKQIAIPTVINSSFEYDGNGHAIELSYDEGTELLIKIYDETAQEYNGSLQYSDAGTYYYTLEIESENYIFTDQTREVQVWMQINKKVLELSKDDIQIESEVFKNSAYTISDLDHNIDLSLFAVEGSFINAGSYSFLVTPNENTTKNYEWNDGSSIGTFYVSFAILKATPDYSNLADQIKENVVFEYDYYEGLKLSEVISSSYPKQESWLEENMNYNHSSSRFYFEGDDRLLQAGTTYETVKYCPDLENYELVDIIVKVVINKAKLIIDANWSISGSVEFDGQSHLNTISPNNNIAVEYKTYYGTISGVYGSDNILEPTNAGYYKTIANLNPLNENYLIYLKGDQETPITQLEKEWQITKVQIEVEYAGIINASWDDINWSDNIAATMFEPAEEQIVSVTFSNLDEYVSSLGLSASVQLYYKDSELGEYSPVDSLKAGGFYKAVVTLNWTDKVNYEFTASTPIECEITVLAAKIDLVGVVWNVENGQTYNLSELDTLLLNIPEGAYAMIAYEDSAGKGGSVDAENFKHALYSETFRLYKITFSVKSNIKNSENAYIENDPTIGEYPAINEISITIVDDIG